MFKFHPILCSIARTHYELLIRIRPNPYGCLMALDGKLRLRGALGKEDSNGR